MSIQEQAMSTTEQRVAEFIVDVKSADIPAAARAAGHQAVFDNVGCMLAGAAQPHGRSIVAFADEEGRPGACTVVGTALRTSRSMAALANGTLGHALDFDDGSGFSHASVNILPAALAVGEPLGVSGRELLDAYVIGLEVGTHLQRGGHYVQGLSGFHMMTIFGVMAATAAAARLLKLDVKQTVMALGIAGSSPSGVIQNFGTPTKPLHAGMTARSGVMAARLAQQDWVACDSILESKAGWAAAFFGADRFDADAMVRGLGTEWTSTNSLLLKRYPCCGSIHGPLDSLLALMQEHGFAAHDVAEVEVAGLPAHSHVLFYPQPTAAFQGKFSMQYSIATALIDGRIDVDSYSEDRLARPEFAETLRKVRIGIHTKWDGGRHGAAGMPVTVLLKDGRILTRSTERHRIYGKHGNPMVEDDLRAKFHRNALLVLEKAAVTEAQRRWWHLDGEPDIRQALAAVATPAA